MTAPADHALPTADLFKDAFRTHPAGIAVITAQGPDGPVGLTASSVSSVSAEPPVLAFSVSTASSSAAALVRSDTLVVHLLGADQLEIARLFATGGRSPQASRCWPMRHGPCAAVSCTGCRSADR
jgi:flavin reductase (DIM6/NTAB) family NADH-FMN oxidoreductase RutF